MASDIRVSELNEITRNKCFNEIIVNDRVSTSDLGVTKSIQMCNLLTPNIVNTINVNDAAITNVKLDANSVDASKIVSCTITSDNDIIANRAISTNQIAIAGITPVNINPSCVYSMNGIRVPDNKIIRGGTVVATEVLKTCTGRFDVGPDTRYTFPENQIAGKFLKTDGNGNLTWEAPIESAATTLVVQDVFPVGTIVPWAAGSLPADNKWLECDGSDFDGSSGNYPELAAILGDTWGQRVGNTYKLPNLNGRVPLGSGISSADPNGESCTFGFCTNGDSHTGGTFNHQLCVNELASHCHKYSSPHMSGQPNAKGVGAGIGSPYQNHSVWSIPDDDNTVSTGGNEGHNNIQPYAIVRYIIKAKPDTLQSLDLTLGAGLSAKDKDGNQASNIELTSTGIGMKITEDFEFNGQNQLKLSPSAPTGTELGTFKAVEACGGGCVLGTVTTGRNYLRAWNKTTGCVNFDKGAGSFVCIGDGQAGQYYPENTTSDKTCAKICFQKPGVYKICYTGNTVEWNHVAYLVARQGSTCKIGYDIRGNQIHSDQVGNIGSANDGQSINFERTILVPSAGCAFIYQRIVNGTGRMGYSKYKTSFGGSGGSTGGSCACAIFANLKITRVNHYNTNMTPATGSMTSFYKDI